MRFYHVIKNSEGVTIEENLCDDNKKRFSMECLQTAVSGEYLIIPQKI